MKLEISVSKKIITFILIEIQVYIDICLCACMYLMVNSFKR